MTNKIIRKYYHNHLDAIKFLFRVWSWAGRIIPLQSPRTHIRLIGIPPAKGWHDTQKFLKLEVMTDIQPIVHYIKNQGVLPTKSFAQRIVILGWRWLFVIGWVEKTNWLVCSFLKKGFTSTKPECYILLYSMLSVFYDTCTWGPAPCKATKQNRGEWKTMAWSAIADSNDSKQSEDKSHSAYFPISAARLQ